jgi:hypothetical protein
MQAERLQSHTMNFASRGALYSFGPTCWSQRKRHVFLTLTFEDDNNAQQIDLVLRGFHQSV